jgi:hypothetical protein
VYWSSHFGGRWIVYSKIEGSDLLWLSAPRLYQGHHGCLTCLTRSPCLHDLVENRVENNPIAYSMANRQLKSRFVSGSNQDQEQSTLPNITVEEVFSSYLI